MSIEPTSVDERQPSRTRRILNHPLVRIALELGLFLGTLVVLKITVIKPGLGLLGLDENAFRASQGVISLIAMFFVYVLIMRWYERRPVGELSMKQLVPDALIGGLGACLMVSLVFAALSLFGAYQILSASSISAMAVPAIWALVLAATEEFMFRGIVYRILQQWLGTIAALLISAAVFGLAHLTNDHPNAIGILSACLGGVLLGVLYSMTGRLWIPIFFHASWNLTQAIFGSTVSGEEFFGTYFESVRDGPEWLTGGPTGVENSVITLVLITLVIGVSLPWMKRHGLIVQR